ncbi:hypothetical protein JHK82_043380 [Glycine max]|nr:hypothetical protein JHK82_043380 [Glycine max]
MCRINRRRRTNREYWSKILDPISWNLDPRRQIIQKDKLLSQGKSRGLCDLGARPEVGGGGEVVEEDGLPEGLGEPPLGAVAVKRRWRRREAERFWQFLCSTGKRK